VDPDSPAQGRLTTPFASLRTGAAGLAARRAAVIESRSPRGAVRWLRLSAWLAPRFGEPHRHLFRLCRSLDDRWGAYRATRRAVTRFPHSAEAWMLAGEAATLVFRQAEALAAYEEALVIEERADAALAAGALYARAGQHAHAAARFARGFAAGGGPEALRQNAEALRRAGDEGAADEAMRLLRELSSRAGTA
jgi:tetratricopeptide (TPR) repeat protein